MEWLYQDIQKVYEQQKRNEEKREKRDKVKERIYLGLMALLALSSIFIDKRVADEIHMPLWAIGLSASIVMIFLFWMYFKTRMGIGFSRNDLIGIFGSAKTPHDYPTRIFLNTKSAKR